MDSSKEQECIAEKRKLLISEINTCLRLKQFSRIDSLLLTAMRSPIDSEVLVKLGHLLYRIKRYEKSIISYSKALEDDKLVHKDEVIFGLGQVYYKLKRYSDSFLYYSLLKSNYPSCIYIDYITIRMSLIYKFNKNFDSAVSVLLAILHDHAKNKNVYVEALCIVGNCYELQGELDIGLDYYIKAVEILKNFRTVTCVAWGYLSANPKMTEGICKKYLRRQRPNYE